MDKFPISLKVELANKKVRHELRLEIDKFKICEWTPVRKQRGLLSRIILSEKVTAVHLDENGHFEVKEL